MQVIIEADEAWSLMALLVSQVIDQSGISQDSKNKLRNWRTQHADGTVEMDEVAVEMNEILGTVLDEKTTKLIRQRGHYISTRDRR
jgi:hypothetical protein